MRVKRESTMPSILNSIGQNKSQGLHTFKGKGNIFHFLMGGLAQSHSKQTDRMTGIHRWTFETVWTLSTLPIYRLGPWYVISVSMLTSVAFVTSLEVSGIRLYFVKLHVFCWLLRCFYSLRIVLRLYIVASTMLLLGTLNCHTFRYYWRKRINYNEVEDNSALKTNSKISNALTINGLNSGVWEIIISPHYLKFRA